MTHQSLSQRVADNVRAELARAKISQAKLASEINFTQQAISRRLSGHVSFTIDELDSIAAVLGISLITLLGDEIAA